MDLELLNACIGVATQEPSFGKIEELVQKLDKVAASLKRLKWRSIPFKKKYPRTYAAIQWYKQQEEASTTLKKKLIKEL